MHGAGHWVASAPGSRAGRSILQSKPSTSTPPTSGRIVERERVTFLLIVGDAFARPLLDELERQPLRPLVADRDPVGRRAAVGRDRRTSCSRTCRRVDDRRRPGLVRGGRPAHARLRPAAPRTTGTVPGAAGSVVLSSAPRRACSQPGRRRARVARQAGPARRSATSATRSRRTRPTRSSTACATPYPATAPACGRRHGRAARPRLGHHQLGRREDLRRGGRGGDQGPSRRSTTAWWRGGRASAGAARSSPSSTSAPARSPTPDELVAEAARHLARYKLPKSFVFVDAGRALAGRQGRLPLGPRGRCGKLDEMSRRPWDDTALPEGDAKVAAVREMFDTIAPRYDLVNRVMTFRLDGRWRRADGCLARPAQGCACARPRFGYGRPVRRPRQLRLSRRVRRPVARHAGAPTAAACPAVQADILRLPLPDGIASGATSGFALRNLVDLARVLRRAGAGACDRGGRVALPRCRDTAQPGSCGPAMPSTSARSSLWSGRASLTHAPTGTCPAAWCICRRQRRCWLAWRTPASRGSSAAYCPAASPSC